MVVDILVKSALAGGELAWREIVRRYSPLVLSVCRRHGLSGSDADDVTGNVWLRLVVSLGTLREPAALPGWLATTSRNECLQLLRARRHDVLDGEVDEVAPAVSVAGLVAAEERAVVRAALATLPDRDRTLLTMLFADPPMPYAEISARLGMPVGAIGPTRQRCLARMRRVPSVAALTHHAASA
jgi:RNA polymerase sigma factor (sigma-70 family)